MSPEVRQTLYEILLEIEGACGAYLLRQETVNGCENEPWGADRGLMRTVLAFGLESYKEFGPEFGREFTSYIIIGSGVSVVFTNRAQVKGRLVVDDDGAQSRIRRQLALEFSLLDTETRLIYGKTQLTTIFEMSSPKIYLRGPTLIQDCSEESRLSLMLETMQFKSNKCKDCGDLPEDNLFWLYASEQLEASSPVRGP
ncbi:hypothetical protein WAI453_010180 [Rhynchosporium graminicola]